MAHGVHFTMMTHCRIHIGSNWNGYHWQRHKHGWHVNCRTTFESSTATLLFAIPF